MNPAPPNPCPNKQVPLGDGEELPRSRRKRVPTEVGGCGGFGKGNFG